MNPCIFLGDWLEIPAEGIEGYITELFQNDSGEFVSAVVCMPDGQWAAVDLTGLQSQSETLH